jgi:hypothetical protein
VTPRTCGSGGLWAASNSQATGPTLVIGCSSAACNASYPYYAASSSVASLSTCRSSNEPLPNVATGRILVVDLIDRNPVPDVRSVLLKSMRTAISVTVLTDIGGTIYCAAYTALAIKSGLVVSSNDIKSKNNVKATSNNTAFITLSSLSPAEEYMVYCTSVSLDGVEMDPSKLRQQKNVVKTQCCKYIELAVLQPAMQRTAGAPAVASVSLSDMPSDRITLSFTLNYTADISATGDIGPFLDDITLSSALYPTTVTVISAINFAGKVLSFSPLQRAGLCSMGVVVGGSSALGYSIRILSVGAVIKVTEADIIIPPPIFDSAAFSADGSLISVKFSAPTDKAAMIGVFPCGLLLYFPLASSSNCVWLNDQQLSISLPGVSTLKPDNSILLLAAKVKTTTGLCFYI